jgi:Tol biopolymer transport system component
MTQLFTMAPDGRNLQQLTNIAQDDKWPTVGSYTGSSVIYTAGPLNPPDPTAVYPQYMVRYDVAGGQVTPLISNVQAPYPPAYSMYPQMTPDKTRIYFYSYGFGDASQAGIWIMNADGSSFHRIIDANAIAISPLFPAGASLQAIAAWQP